MQGSTVATTLKPVEEILTLEDIEEEEPEYEIPTGEGLNRKEAQALLIKEMNRLIQLKNTHRLETYRRKVAAYGLAIQHNANLKEGEEKVTFRAFPVLAPLAKSFNARQIQQAVNMARKRGGYDSLIEAAGYRAKK